MPEKKDGSSRKKWNNIFVMSSFSSYCCYKNIVSRISTSTRFLFFFLCSFWVLFSCALDWMKRNSKKLIICFFHSRFSTFLIFLNFAHRHHRFVFEFIASNKYRKGHNGAIVKINYFNIFSYHYISVDNFFVNNF